MNFEIRGEIVPYTRMTQGSKWTERSRRYLESKGMIQLLVRNQMQLNGYERLPDKTEFGIVIRFWRRNLFTCDVDNLAKAVMDALNDIAFDDDRYCVEMLVSKTRAAKKNDSCSLAITPR